MTGTGNKAAIFLVVCGIGLLLYGINRGEYDTVFLKAVNICLECIGIG